MERERDMMPVAKAVYMELVSVLRRKVVWPPRAVLNGWPRGELVPAGSCDQKTLTGGADQRGKFKA